MSVHQPASPASRSGATVIRYASPGDGFRADVVRARGVGAWDLSGEWLRALPGQRDDRRGGGCAYHQGRQNNRDRAPSSPACGRRALVSSSRFVCLVGYGCEEPFLDGVASRSHDLVRGGGRAGVRGGQSRDQGVAGHWVAPSDSGAMEVSRARVARPLGFRRAWVERRVSGRFCLRS
jgi:hypothetical protein